MLLMLLSLFAGFLVSTISMVVLVRAGRRAGMLDTPGTAGHEKVLRAIPNIGGVGIFLGAVGPLAIGLLVLLGLGGSGSGGLASDEGFDLPFLKTMLDDGAPRIGQLSTWIAIVVGALVLHLVGLVDDRRPIGAWPKLGVQVGLAALLVLFFDVRLLHLLDDFGAAGRLASVVCTVLWIVVITNAFNFLDNMDGLAGGVAAIAAFIMLAATLLNAQWYIGASLAMLLGSLVGFLIFNFPPARIFMGDGGSLVVGWLLAVATIRITFVDTSDPEYALGTAWYGVLMPLVVLAVPLYDFTSVVLIRCLQGRSPFVGDQQHFSHRLVERGLSRRGAVLMIWGIALLTGTSGIFLGSVRPAVAILIGLLTLVLLGALAALEYGTRAGASDE